VLAFAAGLPARPQTLAVHHPFTQPAPAAHNPGQ